MRALPFLLLFAACQGTAFIETDPEVIARGQPTPSNPTSFDPTPAPATVEPTPDPSFFLDFGTASDICFTVVESNRDSFESDCGFELEAYEEFCGQLDLFFPLQCETLPGRFDQCVQDLVERDGFCTGEIPETCLTFIDSNEQCI